VLPIYRTTALLTSRCCILYIYSTNISIKFFLTRCNISFFSLQNVVYFVTLNFLVPVLFTFYIQGVLKFKCQILVPKCWSIILLEYMDLIRWIICRGFFLFLANFTQFSHKQFQVDTCGKLENYTVSLITLLLLDSHLKIFGGADMGYLLMCINGYLPFASQYLECDMHRKGSITGFIILQFCNVTINAVIYKYTDTHFEIN
jgi:hypothetical protein